MRKTPTVTAAEIVDDVRGLLASRGAFEVADGLFVEGDEVLVLVVADEAPPEVAVDLAEPVGGAGPLATAEVDLTEPHGALDVVVTVRAPGVLGLAGTPVAVLAGGLRLVGELDERGRARIGGVPPGRAQLEVGPLRGLAPVVPLHQRPGPPGQPARPLQLVDGVLEPATPMVSRELAHAAQTGRRVGPAQHWRSLDGALTVELAESDERRLLLTVSRRAEDVEAAAVRVTWEARDREAAEGGTASDLVTPLVPGFGGRRASVRYDLGSAEPFVAFGIVGVEVVPLDELTEGDLENALLHGPYGSAVRSWQAIAAAGACPPAVAARIDEQLG